MAMTSATLTSKGQVTIPAAIRVALGLDAGSRIEFLELEPGKYAIIPATSSVQALKGMLKKPAVPVTLEDMNRAIQSEGAKAR
jgi:antitoxin PrlF